MIQKPWQPKKSEYEPSDIGVIGQIQTELWLVFCTVGDRISTSYYPDHFEYHNAWLKFPDKPCVVKLNSSSDQSGVLYPGAHICTHMLAWVSFWAWF